MRRIVVRAPTADDAEAFTAAMRASRQHHRPWISMPQTAEAYAAYLARTERGDFAPFIACRTEDGAITGFANVSHDHPRPAPAGVPELRRRRASSPGRAT